VVKRQGPLCVSTVVDSKSALHHRCISFQAGRVPNAYILGNDFRLRNQRLAEESDIRFILPVTHVFDTGKALQRHPHVFQAVFQTCVRYQYLRLFFDHSQTRQSDDRLHAFDHSIFGSDTPDHFSDSEKIRMVFERERSAAKQAGKCT
jgi:hypothetical protein